MKNKFLFPFLFFILSIIPNDSQAQSLGFYCNPNFTKYHLPDFKNYDNWNYKTGFTTGIQFQYFNDTILPIFAQNFGIYYSYNTAEYIGPTNSYHSGSNYMTLETKRSWVGFNMYPINIQLIKKQWLISIGGFFQYDISSRFFGDLNILTYDANNHFYYQNKSLTSQYQFANKSVTGLCFSSLLLLPHNEKNNFWFGIQFQTALSPEYNLVELLSKQFLISFGMRHKLKL